MDVSLNGYQLLLVGVASTNHRLHPIAGHKCLIASNHCQYRLLATILIFVVAIYR